MENPDEGTYKWDGSLLALSCGCKMEFDSDNYDLLEAEYCNFIQKLNFIKRSIFYQGRINIDEGKITSNTS